MKKIIPVLFLISLGAFSISFEKIGDWGFGRYQQIAMKGNIVYGISEESGISVIDYSDVKHPLKVGEFSRTEKFHNMLIDGDTAYISMRGKIFITDISNVIPQTVSIIDLDADCYRMALVGDKLYVAGGYAGLVVVDVSDKTHPSMLGNYIDEDNMTNVIDVAVNENGDIYVVDKEMGLYILQTSDYKNFERVGRMKAKMNRVEILDSTHIVLSYGQQGIKFYNSENTHSLKYIGSYNEVNYISDFVIDGDVMYCSDNYNGLLILDISTFGAPSLIKSVPTPTICYSLVKNGDHVFTANSTGGIYCYDVSSPSEPKMLSFYSDSSYPMDMVYTNNHLLLADFYNGIKSLSGEDLANLDLKDLKRGEGYPVAIAMKDNYIYYADTAMGVGVLKLEQDGTLSDINYLELDGNFLGLAIYNNNLFCAAEYGGLYQIDITNRENPVVVNEIYKFQSVVKVRANSDGFLTLACGFNGVKILKISGGNLQEIADIDVDGYAIDAQLKGNTLFVADSYNGLWVLTLNTSYQIESSKLLLGGKNPESFALSDDRLYVACGDKGVFVLKGVDDFSQIGFIATHSNAKKVLISGNFVFIAEGLSGKVDVFRVVTDGTKVYSCPSSFEGELSIFNGCARSTTVDVIVSNNLTPLQFKRVTVKARGKVSIHIKRGDTVKCLTEGNRIKAMFLPFFSDGCEMPLPLSNNSYKVMTGNTSPFAFYHLLSIENTSLTDSYFTIYGYNANGKLVFSKDVFIEFGMSKSIPFVFNKVHSFRVESKMNFKATLLERGATGVNYRYLEGVRLERY